MTQDAVTNNAVTNEAKTVNNGVETPWSESPDHVTDQLGTNVEHGLDAHTAIDRAKEFGLNVLPQPAKKPAILRFLGHFDDILIYILVASGVLKAIMGEWIDFTVIVAVAIINAVIGFVQEGRSERALDGIRNMLSTTATVRRDNEWLDIDTAELVPGDVIRLSPGAKVPTDARLITATNLQVEESALTGESVASTKSTDAVIPTAGVGDRTSMVFSGTLVSSGTGTAVVTATGASTEIGRIQALTTDVEHLETPLSRQLGDFGKRLSVAILGMAAVMLLIGRLIHNWPLGELISAAIGFAVAAIPEGLPAVVTVTLALGVQTMARRKAITRKLPAVEGLGAVNVICSDKTGTLTKNEMTAKRVVLAHGEVAVSGDGYEPEGSLSLGGAAVTFGDRQDLDTLLEVMAWCNDTDVRLIEGHWGIVGEPTEGALRTLTKKAQTPQPVRRIDVLPFDSERKYMATLDERADGSTTIQLKGAPDRVLDRCTAQRREDGSSEPIDRDFWEHQIDELGGQGMRVLAAATRKAEDTQLDPDTLGDDFELCGFVAIVDPPRPEAIEAVALCQRAGIDVKMITGDHAGTAVAIATELGITKGVSNGDETDVVLTGAELEAMSDAELAERVEAVNVYARTSPEHKIRIVRALQHRGQIVAMTGDGVNDAPALTRANVGIAMGIKGTEATKDAADIVLADDNFATIERAVEEGRRIYDNIRKSVLFLLPTNGAQSLVVLVAVLFGLTLPLEPVQILWVNMVTALTLSLALVFEPAEPGIMDRPPRSAKGSIVNGPDLGMVGIVSALVSAATLGVFWLGMSRGMPLAEAQTAAVTMLALGQLAYLFNCRNLHGSSLKLSAVQGNPAVWWSAVGLIALQLIFTYVPIMHVWFRSAAIDIETWLVALAGAVIVFLLVEVVKAIRRR